MPKVAVRCPNGHRFQWTSQRDPATVKKLICPKCGAVIDSDVSQNPEAANTKQPNETHPSPSLAEGAAASAGKSTRKPRPVVPGYEILGTLGHGGMGVVYKARHQKLKRVVALKMIIAGAHASRKQLARFQTEAEAVANLKHPNIVQLYEIGECDGLPYFSLEFVEGGTLEDKIEGQRLLPRWSAKLVETLVRAMHYAHEQGS